MEENIQQPRYYLTCVKKMRLLLMIGAILYTYGIFPAFQEESGVVLGFVFPALFIISGYVVLWGGNDIEQRILRTIKRTAICFLILLVVYFGLSMLVDVNGTMKLISSKRFWFDLVVLNVCSLPIGSTIWYVQSLLYAYIVIYFINKFKLLKFDIYISLIFLAIAVLTGELSSVIGFDFLGKTYIGGNFFTRALPYILIGRFIQRNEDYFFKKLSFLKHILILVFGIILTVSEYLILTFSGAKLYVGHLFGMGVIAFAVCLFSFFISSDEIQSVLIGSLSRFELMIPFFVCSPIYYVVCILIQLTGDLYGYLKGFVGIITLLLSFAVLYIYAFIRYLLFLFIHRKDGQPTE